MVMIVFLIIYYLDRYDIPSKFNLGLNVNTQNWLSFIGNYVTGIISSIIAALVAVWTTLYQIKKNNEENDKRDKENFRIQNMPLIKYDCIEGKESKTGLTQLDTNIDNNKGVVQQITISLKNIGLNTIRKYYIKVESEILKHEYTFNVNNENVIEKGQEIIIPFVMRLETSKTYFFEFTIFYQDLLLNTYKQRVQLKYTLYSYNDGSRYNWIHKFDIKNEENIDEFPKMKIINI